MDDVVLGQLIQHRRNNREHLRCLLRVGGCTKGTHGIPRSLVVVTVARRFLAI